MNKTKNKPAEARRAPIGDTEAGTMRDTVLLVDGYTKSYGGKPSSDLCRCAWRRERSTDSSDRTARAKPH